MYYASSPSPAIRSAVLLRPILAPSAVLRDQRRLHVHRADGVLRITAQLALHLQPPVGADHEPQLRGLFQRTVRQEPGATSSGGESDGIALKQLAPRGTRENNHEFSMIFMDFMITNDSFSSKLMWPKLAPEHQGLRKAEVLDAPSLIALDKVHLRYIIAMK